MADSDKNSKKSEIYNTNANTYLNTVALAHEKIKGKTKTRCEQRGRFMKYLSNLAKLAGLDRTKLLNSEEGRDLSETVKDIVINEDFDNTHEKEEVELIKNLISCNGDDYVEKNINELLGL